MRTTPEFYKNVTGTPMATGFATAHEAAVFLNVSKAMVHKLIATNEIPAVRFGKRAVRIPMAWLLDQASAVGR